jgi:hypothetical protein
MNIMIIDFLSTIVLYFSSVFAYGALGHALAYSVLVMQKNIQRACNAAPTMTAVPAHA